MRGCMCVCVSIGGRGSVCLVMSRYQWIRNVSADATQGCDGTHWRNCVGRMSKRNEILTIGCFFHIIPFIHLSLQQPITPSTDTVTPPGWRRDEVIPQRWRAEPSPPRWALPVAACHTAMSIWARHSASALPGTPDSSLVKHGELLHTHTHTNSSRQHGHMCMQRRGATLPTLHDGHILECPIAHHRLWVIRRGCSSQTIDSDCGG